MCAIAMSPQRHAVIALVVCVVARLPTASLGQATRAVTTVAGGGGSSSAGTSDGIGTAALFNGPISVALGSNATFAVVADYYNHALRRIDISSGIVTTLAGTPGSAGFADGPLPTGTLNCPNGVAMDAAGTVVFLVDNQNNALRRVNTSTGVLSTVAGTSSPSAADGVGSAAGFNAPTGVAADAGGSFVILADAGNHVLRRVIIGTANVTTIAGRPASSGTTDGVGSAAQFNSPRGVALTGSGSVGIVADHLNHVVRLIRVSSTSGNVTTLAGAAGQPGSADGVGLAARFSQPTGVALDAAGSVAIVADYGNSLLRRINMTSGVVTTMAGQAGQTGRADGIGTLATFNNLYHVSLEVSGSFALIADFSNNLVRSIFLGSPSTSQTPTASASPTETQTLSATITASRTPTSTQSSSQSPSPKSTPSCTSTGTPSQQATASQSPTPSESSSFTPTITVTLSQLTSPSSSQSQAGSASGTQSTTATPTQSKLPSVSQSVSVAPTAAQSFRTSSSGTASMSATMSGSITPSFSPSSSQSASVANALGTGATPPPRNAGVSVAVLASTGTIAGVVLLVGAVSLGVILTRRSYAEAQKRRQSLHGVSPGPLPGPVFVDNPALRIPVSPAGPVERPPREGFPIGSALGGAAAAGGAPGLAGRATEAPLQFTPMSARRLHG